MNTCIKKATVEDIDKERAKVDFVYFATHCLIDAKTGKLFKWSSTQIKLMKKLVQNKERRII